MSPVTIMRLAMGTRKLEARGGLVGWVGMATVRQYGTGKGEAGLPAQA